jgi:2'-5' RNA ligase
MPPLTFLKAVADSELPPYAFVVDFDDTITKHKDGHFDRLKDLPAPSPKIVKRIRRAHDAGIPVVIFSFRWSSEIQDREEAEAQRQLVSDYLEKHDIPYDSLWKGDKPFGFIIDDNGANAEDFSRIDKKLDEMIERKKQGGVTGILANDAKREFGCLMADAPAKLTKAVLAWGEEHVPDDVIYDDDSGQYGREKQSHVTVNFGFVNDPDIADLQDAVAQVMTGPIHIKLGEVSKFEPAKYDVLKVDVISEDLNKIHAALLKKYEIEETHPEYKPHLTIAYVKAGSCDDLLGNQDFMGQEWEIDGLDYSSKDSKHNKFEMAPSAEIAALLFVDHLLVSAGVEASFADQKNRWVHYSDVQKVGVNPKSQWFDPAGIYLFPEDAKVGQMWKSKANKYFIEFTGTNVFDLSTLGYDDAIGLIKAVGLQPSEEADALKYMEETREDQRPGRGWKHTFWEYLGRAFGRATGKRESGKFNKFLRDQGYDAVWDEDGNIYYGEDKQLLVLDPTKVKVLGVESGELASGSGFEDLKTVVSALVEKLEAYGEVTATEPKKMKDSWTGPVIRSEVEVTADEDHRARFNVSISLKDKGGISVSLRHSEPRLDMGVGATVQRSPLDLAGLDALNRDLEKIFKSPSPVLAFIRADQAAALAHAAKTAVQSDPKWVDYAENPEHAEELGNIQRELDKARTETEIREIWDRYQPTTPFDSLLNGESPEEGSPGLQG